MKLIKDLGWLKIYDDALTKEECKDLVEFCDDKLYNQPLLTGDASYRTSNQYFIPLGSGVDDKINTITSEITKLPMVNQELTSVVRYEKGQEYKEHWDFFFPNTDEHEQYVINTNNANRVMTVLFYLGDDCKGGETVFPKIPISITPKVGTCLSWVNMYGDEQYNNDSLHAGLPVKSGTKYIATKWVRGKEFKI